MYSLKFNLKNDNSLTKLFFYKSSFLILFSIFSFQIFAQSSVPIIEESAFVFNQSDSKILKNNIHKEVDFFNSLNESENLRCGGWCTAIVDAGGALGGAGSVASFPGGQACPWCLAGGALLGGAGASIAAYDPLVVGNGPDISLSNEYSINNNNEYNNIGEEHNNLIRQFIESELPIDPESVYNFFKNKHRNSEHSVAFQFFTLEALTNEMDAAKNANTNIDSALQYLKSRLPHSIDKNKFISDLRNTLEFKNVDSELKNLENNFFSGNNELSNKDNIAMKAFFAILRNSGKLWN